MSAPPPILTPLNRTAKARRSGVFACVLCILETKVKLEIDFLFFLWFLTGLKISYLVLPMQIFVFIFDLISFMCWKYESIIFYMALETFWNPWMSWIKEYTKKFYPRIIVGNFQMWQKFNLLVVVWKKNPVKNDFSRWMPNIEVLFTLKHLTC